MPKIALNIICKNESHIINRLLESVRPMINIIVAVDTGSDDNTIDLINQFGQQYSIPTFVFERPFDNFCNSRNYAMDMLLDVAIQLQWDLGDSWGFSIDCDERLVIFGQWAKNELSKDIYEIIIETEEVSFMRKALFRLSINFRWESPVHELLVPKDPPVSLGLLDCMYVKCASKGASWKADLEQKFLKYTRILIEYIDAGHADFKTLHDTARSFVGAAINCKSPGRAKEHRLAAKRYYEMAMEIKDVSDEEKIMLYRDLALNKIALEEEWLDTKDILLKSYALNMFRGESISYIIKYYMSKRRWNTAYLFSHFSEKLYNGNDPIGVLGGVSESYLYRWGFLQSHIICSYMSGNRIKARLFRRKLKAYMITNIKSLSVKEMTRMQSSNPVNLFFKFWSQKLFFSSKGWPR